MSTPPFSVTVVDDDQALRQAITRLLQVSGHDVHGFASAEAFLSDMPGKIDCLVLDIDLGARSGLALYRQLRERDAAAPVIFISGNCDPGHARESDALGATDFLLKPFEGSALIAAVRRACAAGADRS